MQIRTIGLQDPGFPTYDVPYMVAGYHWLPRGYHWLPLRLPAGYHWLPRGYHWLPEWLSMEPNGRHEYRSDAIGDLTVEMLPFTVT